MRSSLLLSALATTLLGSACITHVETDPYDDFGSLTIEYTFGGLSCRDAGVDRVYVEVDGTRDGDAFTVSCAEFDYGITIDSLRDGRYDVYIEGKDIDGNLLYSTRDSVRVDAFAHQVYTIDVGFETGQLTVYWTFEGSGRCDDIRSIRIRLHDGNGYAYDDDTYDCDFGGLVYDLMPKGVWYLDIDAIDFGNRITYRASDVALFVESNASNDYTVDLIEVR